MAGFGEFVMSLGILGYLCCCCGAWNINMPREITGLLDSCLVIPCSFSYYQYPPENPDRVVWYQYVSSGYPLVYDDLYPDEVIDAFQGKTRVFTSSYYKTCTLMIEPVTWSHDRQKIYPWVDPENVGRSTYKFYDTTVTINVVSTPNKPVVQVFGSMKIGQHVTVQCSILHTCSQRPPTLSLNIPLINSQLNHEYRADGTTKTILKTTMIVTREHHPVECSVQHAGGRTARAVYHLNAACSKSGLVVAPSAELLEGHTSGVTCTASYTCSNHVPTLTWNYVNMLSSSKTTKESVGWRTVSTIALTPSANDHGRYLTCFARFADGQAQEKSVALQVKKSIVSRDWSFTSPDSLTGLRGSCIVIPCKFSYSAAKPGNLRVIWYLYSGSGYPAVFDQRSGVVGKFAGITGLIGSVQENNCSLKIERLQMSHSHDRLFPWIDRNPITAYHTVGHSMYDKTTQLIVLDRAEEPRISIVGIPRVGEQSKVSCSAQHTCLSAPPSLTISGIPGSDHVLDALVSEGVWERTVERTWTVEEQNQAVKCSVRHPGGQRASSERLLQVQCPFERITLAEQTVEATEGMAISVICTVAYKCQRNKPAIEWNYKDMQSSPDTKKISGISFVALSNLTFIGSPQHDGKNLTCTAKFPTGETTDSATIHINRNILFRGWSSFTPRSLRAMKGSCVIIPCRFSYSISQPGNLEVLWYLYQKGGYPAVFNQRAGSIIGRFAGMTSLVGSVWENNCSLKIEKVEMSHSDDRLYPWIDEYPITSYNTMSHSFRDETTQLIVSDQAEEPRISITGVPRVGEQSKVSCSVQHTCPSAPPSLTISGIAGTDHVLDALVSEGVWERTVERTWTVGEEDQAVKCSVSHPGGQRASSELKLDVDCPHDKIAIVERQIEATEGVPMSVMCAVSHKCKKNTPIIVWNYSNMLGSLSTKAQSQHVYSTVSKLTFIGSPGDDGKMLTCTAQFTNGETSDSAIIQIKRNMAFRDWSLTTPGSMAGMRGSCIVIPCKFGYSTSQPENLQVAWFLHSGSDFQAAYDPGASDVVGEFRGVTSLVGSVRDNNCSLKIERLQMSHNGDRLFPWIDKNPITSYNTRLHSLYDKTTQLVVSDQAEKPRISITGVPRVGEQSKVSCSVQHTCLSAPPSLTISGIPGSDRVLDALVSEGVWERTVERTWTVGEEDQAVKCSVSHPGGQTALSELKLDVDCPHDKITMVERPGVVKEGRAKNVVCAVSHKCQKNTPTIVWDSKERSSQSTRKMSDSSYSTVSNLTFIGSPGDDGKTLTCTARFTTGVNSDSATIRIRSYQVLAADVPIRFRALTRSCVVVPCSFTDPEVVPMTRGIWSKKTGGIVFHNGQSRVIDHFKGRTRLLGNLQEGNCSMEIDDIKPFDNGPFCFHAEKGEDKFKFNNSCVFLLMTASPEKPVMTAVPAEVDAGSTVTVSCTVTHTCPSHPPVFSWSVQNLTSEELHTMTSPGVWETTSTITFLVSGGDGVLNLMCTATFWRDKQQASIARLNVKGSLMHQLRSSAPVAFPVALLVLTVVVLAAVFGICTWKKRKHTSDAQGPPPRPEKRRSLWDRLSRRYPEGMESPPRPEKQRKSIWARLSRRFQEDRVGWNNGRSARMSIWNRFSRRQGNTTDLSVGYLCSNNSVVFEPHGDKPPLPPPAQNFGRYKD